MCANQFLKTAPAGAPRGGVGSAQKRNNAGEARYPGCADPAKNRFARAQTQPRPPAGKKMPRETNGGDASAIPRPFPCHKL